MFFRLHWWSWTPALPLSHPKAGCSILQPTFLKDKPNLQAWKPHIRGKSPGISTPCSTSWHGVNGLTYTHTQSWAIHLIVPAALMASLGSFHHHQNGNSHCSGRREAELERAAILEGKGQDQQIPRKTWLYCLHTCWGVCVCVRGVVSTCIRRHSVKIMHAQMHTGSFPLSVF